MSAHRSSYAILGFLLILFSQQVAAQSGPALNVLADSLYKAGRLAEALRIEQKAVSRIREDSGARHIAFAHELDNMATIYTALGNFQKARLACDTAIQIILQLKGAHSEEYASVLQGDAMLDYYGGDIKKAKSKFRQAIELERTIRGIHDSAYANALSNLASIYFEEQAYNEALALSINALEIYTQFYPQHAFEYVYLLNNMAQLYSSLGSLSKAREYFEEAITLFKSERLPNEHPIYPLLLNNMGVYLMQTGNYEAAAGYFKQATEQQISQPGKLHPNYLTLLNNSGYLEFLRKNYDTALISFKEVLNIWKNIGMAQSLYYGYSLTNISLVYTEKGDWQTADSLFEQARTLCEKNIGRDNVAYAIMTGNMAALKQRQKQYSRAFDYHQQLDSILISYVSHNFYGLSEKEKLNLIATMQLYFQLLPSLMQLHPPNDPGPVADEIYRTQLTLKNMVLRNQTNLLKSIRGSHDTAVLRLYNIWKENKSQLVKEYSKQYSRKNHFTDSLEKATEKLEQQLALRSPDFSREQQYFQLAPTTICSSLQKDEAAIEFIRYALYEDGWTDKVFYSALLLLPGAPHVIHIPLCSEDSLASLLDPGGCAEANLNKLIRDLYQPIQQKNGQSRGKLLCDLLWQPLLPYLKNSRTIYISPVGLLHQLSFSALLTPRNGIPGNAMTIRNLLSTAEVATLNPKPAPVQKVSLWANIDYTTLPVADTVNSGYPLPSANIYFDYAKRNQQKCSLNSNFNPLHLTGEEITAIRTLCDKSQVTLAIYSDTVACEERLKQLSFSGPSVLHISTHGFFLRDSLFPPSFSLVTWDAPLSVRPDPLLRSGLALSGANAAWQGKTVAGREDGILTAYEVAQMDLTNAALVILDACETGLGSNYGTEGIFGLQRAFKLAGADKIIMSLWQVPEKESNELMIQFYMKWLGGLPIRQAFEQACNSMQKKYPPYYWAGFILVE